MPYSFNPGDRIGQEIVGHFRILALDHRVSGLVVAIDVVVPADDGGIDEALHHVGLALDEVAPRLDQGGIAVEAVIGEQEHLGLEPRLLFDRIGLGGDIALHGAVTIGEERLRIERIGSHPPVGESVIGFEPLEIARHALLGHVEGEVLEILDVRDGGIGVGDQDLGVLLEQRRNHEGRNVALDRIEGLERIGTQEEIDLADRQQDAVVDLRAARHDGDVEAVAAVGAVGQRLVEAAVLGLRDPVGGEGRLVERLGRWRGIAGRQYCRRQRDRRL